MTARQLNISTIAVLALATAGFVLGLMNPGRRALREACADVVREQQKVAERQRQVGDISDVYRELLVLSKDVSSFRTRLPSDRHLGEFLNELSDALTKLGIREYFVQPSLPLRVDGDTLPPSLRVAQGTGILPVKVVFRAGFDDVFAALEAIESLPRLTYIEELDVEALDEQGGRLSVTMIVQAFHYSHDRLASNTMDDMNMMAPTNR